MIRDATADDLSAIMAIERASFPDDAWSEAMMREELTSPHGRYLVVEEAGRLLGYGGLRAPRGVSDADVQTIALTAHARGRGRGRALLRALLDAAAEAGADRVFLDVRDDNPAARALYASEGFAEIGRRPRYYPGPVDAVVMRLELASRVLDPSRDDGGSADGSRSVAPDASAPAFETPFTMVPARTGAVCGPDGCS